jgi:phosphoribosylaminoimidazole-succinocarboxamide synthase
LHEEYLKDLKRKEEQVLVMDKEAGGTDAELARLDQQAIEINEQLNRMFVKRGQYQKR